MENQAIQTAQQVTKTGLNEFLSNPFVVFVGKLFLAIIVVGGLIIISKYIAASVKKKIIKNSIVNDTEYVEKVGGLVGDIIFYTLLIFSVFIGFDILGFDVGLLLGGLSFGIGLAFKEILGNMIAGILILTTKDFSLGDSIKIDGPEKYFGRIEEITIRYTVIRDFNNQKIIIPNLTFITSPIKTYTTEEFIRLETTVSVHYNTDLEKAQNVIKDAINSLPFIVNKEKTNIIVDKFGDSGIDIKIYFFIDPNGTTPIPLAISKVNEEIKKALEENDITIPYPHTVITVDKNDQNLLKTLLFIKKK